MLRTFVALIFAVGCIALPPLTTAQQGTPTTYAYDDNGRLRAVITPAGEAVVYEYDAAGNVTVIRRVAADALELFSFSPHEGLPGSRVTFIGVGFGAGVSSVLFNGATATVVSNSPASVVAEVPQNATTGLVTITTPRGSVTTLTPFSVKAPDLIGLIGHWPLDGNAEDTSGKGHNGAITGATPTTGQCGGAYRFNGSAAIDVGNLDFSSGQYTVSSWIRTDLPAATESWKDWLTKLDIGSGSGPFMLFLGDGRVANGGGNGPGLVVWSGGSGVVGINGTNLNYRDGAWHHVAATYQSGSQKLYADGVLVGTNTYSGSLPSNSKSVVIGGIEGFGPFHHRWVGDIDEVAIYDRALDASEITTIYQAACTPSPKAQPRNR